MCGRVTLHHDPDALEALFGGAPDPRPPRYNVAPTDLLPALLASGEWRWARWGLIPGWVDDPAHYKVLAFNARAETVAEKPSFRDAFARARAVVAVSGFYEWRAKGEPWYVVRRDARPMALAALVACRDAREPPCSVAVLTTTPNALLAPIHDRMPVVLAPEDVPGWLRGSRAEAEALLRPCPEGILTAWRVGPAVGSVVHDVPSLIAPLQR